MDKATLDAKLQGIIGGTVTDEAEIKEVLDALGTDAFTKVQLFPKAAQDIAQSYLGEKAFGDHIKEAKPEDIQATEAEILANDAKLKTFDADLSKPEYKEANDALDLLDLSADPKARENLIEAAKQQAYADCLTEKGLDANKYRQSVINNVQLSVYELALANAAASDTPKAASHEAVQTYLAGLAGKPKIKVSANSILSFLAKTSEQVEAKKDAILNKFSAIPAIQTLCASWKTKTDAWDAKLTADYGTKYTQAKNVAKVLGKVAKGAAIGAAMLTVAHAGALGFAVYAAYAINKSVKPLKEKYRNDPAAKGKSILGWMKENPYETIKCGARTVGAVCAGISGWGMATGMGLIRPSTMISGSVAAADVAVAAVRKKGMKGALIGLGASAGSFLAAWGLSSWLHHDGSNADETKVDNGAKEAATENTEEKKTDPNFWKKILGIQDEDKQDTTPPLRSGKTELESDLTTDNKHSDTLKAMLGEDCGCDENSAHVQGNDCETKINIQEKVGYNDKDIEFWNSRIDKFIDPCDEKNLDILFESGKLDLKQFPGIETIEEFKYKFGLLEQYNIENERQLTSAIREMMDQVQEAKCLGTLEEKLAALDKLAPMDKDLANNISDGMNSYDNRGNPLCWEPKVVEQHIEEVKPEPEPEKIVRTTTEPLPDGKITSLATEKPDLTIPRSAADTKGYDLGFSEQQRLPHEVLRKDYNGVEYHDIDPNAQVYNVPLTDGGSVSYKFSEGAVVDAKVSGIKMTEHVKALANRLDGFYPKEQAQAMAMKLTATSEIYNDISSRLENNEDVQHGMKEWMNAQEKVFDKFGMKLDENNRLILDGDFNKEKGIAEFQKWNEKYDASQAKYEAKIAKQQEAYEYAQKYGKDYRGK